jgi:hypothetical protein
MMPLLNLFQLPRLPLLLLLPKLNAIDGGYIIYLVRLCDE